MSNRITLGPSIAKQKAGFEKMMARYEKATAKWPWRDFLTAEEAEILRKADAAKAKWLELNRDRATIQNRAIQRAKSAVGAR